MRVSDLAKLTGTTVRTIRHYQGLGLLDVPHDAAGGQRRYDFSHVARVSRIRWLTAGGLPLRDVQRLLADDSPSDPNAAGVGDQVVTDLTGALAALDAQAATLAAQRAHLADLLARAQRGDGLTPLPQPIDRFYARLLQLAGDEPTRAAIRRERDLLEIAAYRGDLPVGAELFYANYNEHRMAASVAAFGQDRGDPTDEEIHAQAVEQVARMRRDAGATLPELAARVDVGAVRAFYRRAIAMTRDPVERRLWDAVLEELVTTLEELRQP